MYMCANPGKVFRCLAVVVGVLSSFFIMAFWIFLLTREGLPSPGFWTAIKVFGFFLAKAISF